MERSNLSGKEKLRSAVNNKYCFFCALFTSWQRLYNVEAHNGKQSLNVFLKHKIQSYDLFLLVQQNYRKNKRGKCLTACLTTCFKPNVCRKTIHKGKKYKKLKTEINKAADAQLFLWQHQKLWKRILRALQRNYSQVSGLHLILYLFPVSSLTLDLSPMNKPCWSLPQQTASQKGVYSC